MFGCLLVKFYGKVSNLRQLCELRRGINIKTDISKINQVRFLSFQINKQSTKSKMVELKDIQTWEEFAKTESLPEKKTISKNYQIDESKNSELCKKISIFQGDITKLETDAIVNAANNSLLGGGGVDGAIHRAAGPELLAECKTLNGCKTGQAKITEGYELPAKHIIHTVGPKGLKPNYLENCYKNSLNFMITKNLRSIAFPCISTGIYHYPNDIAAHVAAGEVRSFLEKNGSHVDRIIFCLFLDVDISIYKSILQSYFPLN